AGALDSQKNCMIRRGGGLLSRIIFSGYFPDSSAASVSRPKVPEKADFWLPAAAVRRFWSGPRFRSILRPAISQHVLKPVFLPEGVPSMPEVWKKCCLI